MGYYFYLFGQNSRKIVNFGQIVCQSAKFQCKSALKVQICTFKRGRLVLLNLKDHFRALWTLKWLKCPIRKVFLAKFMLKMHENMHFQHGIPNIGDSERFMFYAKNCIKPESFRESNVLDF